MLGGKKSVQDREYDTVSKILERRRMAPRVVKITEIRARKDLELFILFHQINVCLTSKKENLLWVPT